MKSLREYIEQVEESCEAPAVGDYFDLEIARDETLIETHVIDVVEDGIVIEADDTVMKILMHVGYLTEDSNMPTAQDSTSPISGSKDARSHNFDKSSDTDLEEGEDYPHSGTGSSTDMQMAVDMARMKAKTNLLRSIHGDSFQDKPMPDYDEDKVQLVPGQKPGTYQATVRMRQRQAQPTTAPTNEAKYQGREVQLGKKMKGDVKKSKVYVRGPKGNVVKVNFGDPNMKIKKSNPARRKSFRARHNCDNPGPRWKARYWSCRSW